jgi:hypothetical protein
MNSLYSIQPISPSGLQYSASEELAASSLALVQELEVSLERSQRALLARDLRGIEQGTLEQTRLQQKLAMLWPEAASEKRRDKNAAAVTACVGKLDVDAALLAAQRRVLHLGRVQASLLARAQQSLKMISYLAAGPQTTYGPPTPGAIAAQGMYPPKSKQSQ